MFSRMNRGSKYGLFLVALSGLTTSAYGQVGTPPPATDDASSETYTPPEPPKSFTAKGRAELQAQQEQQRELEEQRAQAQAEAQAAKEPEAPKLRGIPAVQVPTILLKQKQNSLVRGDGSGGLRDWWGPLDLHALRISPLITDLKGDQIRAVTYDRHNRVEQRMIANLDLYREIEEKKDTIGGKGGLEGLSEITQIIKPMVEPGTLSIDLYNAEAVSAMQGKFNEEMVREYKRELTKDLQLGGGGSNPLAGFATFMIEDAMREPRFAHDLMVSEILMNLDEVLEAAGLSDRAELLPLGELAGKVKGDRPGRILVRKATPYIMGLTVDEHTNLLMAVRELRENPDIQPMLEIKLVRDGQEVQFIDGPEGAKGGVSIGFKALDPAAAGDYEGFSNEQLPKYAAYLIERWSEIDPDATGSYKDTIHEKYKDLYEQYLTKRRAELAGEGADQGDAGG